jgi:hypothetical protein
MYIWKTKSLAVDIKNNKLESKELKKYYLAMSIFMTLAMYLTALSPRENMIVVLVEVIAIIGVLIFGVSFTYQSNGGDDGTNYISRMTVLALPISIKIFLLSLLVGVCIGVVGEIALLSETVIEWVMTVFIVIMQIIFFWRINVHLLNINS